MRARHPELGPHYGQVPEHLRRRAQERSQQPLLAVPGFDESGQAVHLDKRQHILSEQRGAQAPNGFIPAQNQLSTHPHVSHAEAKYMSMKMRSAASIRNAAWTNQNNNRTGGVRRATRFAAEIELVDFYDSSEESAAEVTEIPMVTPHVSTAPVKVVRKALMRIDSITSEVCALYLRQ